MLRCCRQWPTQSAPPAARIPPSTTVRSGSISRRLQIFISVRQLGPRACAGHSSHGLSAGNIRNWNDTRIRELNTNLTDYLPDADICVIYQSNPSLVTLLFTTVLANTVQKFRDAVRPFPLPVLCLWSPYRCSQITPGLQVNFTNLNPCSFAVDGTIVPLRAHNPDRLWVTILWLHLCASQAIR